MAVLGAGKANGGCSLLHAAGLGYATTVLEGACRAIDLGGSLAAAKASTQAAGVIWLD